MNKKRNLFVSIFLANVRQIARFYSASSQVLVYDSMLKSPSALRFHYRLERLLAKIGLEGVSWFFYALRLSLLFKTHLPVSGAVLATSRYDNHADNINYIDALSNGAINPAYLSRATNPFEKAVQFFHFIFFILPRAFRQIPVSLRLVRRVNRQYGWASAMHVACFMLMFLRFQGVFSKETRAVMTACDFGSEPLALKAAARFLGRKELFTMHGQIPSKFSTEWHQDKLYSRIDSDISFLYGHSSLESYECTAPARGKVFFTGFRGKSLPLRPVPDVIRTVGICLANYFDENTARVLKSLSEHHKGVQFILRLHPGMSGAPNLKEMANITLAPQGERIEDFAARLDCALFGNTGSQLDILKAGCPIAYVDGLDTLGYDDMGLVRYGIIPELSSESRDMLILNQHYADAGWADKFRVYDAMYCADEATKAALGAEIREALKAIGLIESASVPTS